MKGKVVAITGGNTGIGKAAAVGLARAGATVVITSRDAERGAAAVEDVRDRSGNSDVAVMDLDLASFASIRQFAAELLDRYDHLDVLLNNAGLTLSRRTETAEGFETTFGVNHLGHFLLTELLLNRLERNPGGARIVNVSSMGHRVARNGLDFDDLQSRRRYSAMNVYLKSKLANIYFTRELARRVGDGVTANALHPGFVRTELARGGDTGILLSVGVRLSAPFASSPEKGAKTAVYLASSPDVEGVTGGFFYRCKPASISRAAQDDDAARRLWEVSEEMVAKEAPLE